MRERCLNPKHKDFHNYGGRGIRVCDQWASFAIFWKDMGAAWSAGLTLDRVDVNGDYRPENCRWTTRQIQAATRRTYKDTISGFRGVYKAGKRWRALTKHFGQKIHIGYFESPIEAARAFDAATVQIRGRDTVLNFPSLTQTKETYEKISSGG